MPYSQAIVVAGGLAHVPVIVGLFKFVDNRRLSIRSNQETQITNKRFVKVDTPKEVKQPKPSLIEQTLEVKQLVNPKADAANDSIDNPKEKNELEKTTYQPGIDLSEQSKDKEILEDKKNN
tara:strand:- start:98 stop:460 length:363 start_codon:yes stop_codon:yes gene_type:complete